MKLSYSIKSAAAAVDLSPRQIWRYISLGKIQTFRIGRRRLISEDALVAFVESNRTSSGNEVRQDHQPEKDQNE